MARTITQAEHLANLEAAGKVVDAQLGNPAKKAVDTGTQATGTQAKTVAGTAEKDKSAE